MTALSPAVADLLIRNGPEMRRILDASFALLRTSDVPPRSYFEMLRNSDAVEAGAPAGLPPRRSRSRHPPAGYLTPREVAYRWRIHIDKVLVFIHAGELRAFNVASKESRRPRYLVTEEAVREFEAARAACPGGSASATPARRRARKPAPAAARRYF
jgi:hypothetical protein